MFKKAQIFLLRKVYKEGGLQSTATKIKLSNDKNKLILSHEVLFTLPLIRTSFKV